MFLGPWEFWELSILLSGAIPSQLPAGLQLRIYRSSWNLKE